MELLESDSARPRQARYQAALRPDMTFIIDFTALCGLVHHDRLPQAPVCQCRRRKRGFKNEPAAPWRFSRNCPNIYLEHKFFRLHPAIQKSRIRAYADS